MSMENEGSAGRGAQRRRCLLDSGSGGIGKDVGFDQIERARTRAAQGNSPAQGLRPIREHHRDSPGAVAADAVLPAEATSIVIVHSGTDIAVAVCRKYSGLRIGIDPIALADRARQVVSPLRSCRQACVSEGASSARAFYSARPTATATCRQEGQPQQSQGHQ